MVKLVAHVVKQAATLMMFSVNFLYYQNRNRLRKERKRKYVWITFLDELKAHEAAKVKEEGKIRKGL